MRRYNPKSSIILLVLVVSLVAFLNEQSMGSTVDWQDVIQFLSNCQNADGGFGARPEEPSDMRVTGFVIEALKGDLAPDVNKIEFMQENIDVVNCISWISSCQNADGGFGVDPNATLSETGYCRFAVHSLMIFGFEYFPIDYPQVKPSVSDTHYYLHQYIDTTTLVSWLLARQNPDGGFSTYIGGISTASCCGQHGELLGYEYPDIEAGISWYQDAQNPDGGFGMNHAASSTVVGTYFCVNALQYLGRDAYPEIPSIQWLMEAMNYSACVSWLISNQNPDGGWGNTPGEPSDLISTNFARKTLAKLGTLPGDVSGCLSFAMSCYDPNSGGFGNQPDEPSEARPTYCGVRILHELKCTILPGDIDGDCYVDFYDFAVLAESWLECSDPANPDCNWVP